MASLADYNFSQEYQRGKDNTVADFLSRMEDCLPEEEVEEQIVKIPQEGVQAVLDNACTPITRGVKQLKLELRQHLTCLQHKLAWQRL